MILMYNTTWYCYIILHDIDVSYYMMYHNSSYKIVRFISVGECLGLLVTENSLIADRELILLITHFIRPPGSIPGVG